MNINASEDGKIHSLGIYTYDSSGERTVKNDVTQKFVLLNGQNVVSSETDNFTLYPSGMLVFNPSYNLATKSWNMKYTKHYYAGSQRVVSKIGNSPEVGNFLKNWSLQTQIGGEIPINQQKEAQRLYKLAYDSKVSVYEKWKLPISNKIGGFSDYGTEVSNSISVGSSETGGKFFYHSDHLGSTSYITNFAGEVTQHHEYIPFGETFVSEYKNARYNSPYRFNSKEFDSNTGFYYYGARYYNPKTSLWISVDPLADFNPFMNSEHYIDGQHNGGVLNHFNSNPYSYCYQNPVLYVDPNGKQVAFLETRSFAPFKEFGYLPYPNIRDRKSFVGPFKGDNRSHTTSNHKNITHRIQGELTLNLGIFKVLKSNAKETITTEISTNESDVSHSYIEYNETKTSNNLLIKLHNHGNNELVMGSPDIDVNVTANIQKLSNNSSGSSYRIFGKVTGDAFPSQELILRDTKGNATMLSTFSANSGAQNTGPLLMLPGLNFRDMGKFDHTINFDSQGKMIGSHNNVTNKPNKIDNH